MFSGKGAKMPTGYTADIEKGISFEKFALNCARAFGALIEMRDDPMDAQIPKSFKPSTYHQERLAEAKRELEKIKKMTPKEADAEAKSYYEKELASHQKNLAAKRATKDKYQKMLEQVQSWTPPSPDHEELKTFMLEQIYQSIDFDCSEKYMDAPKKISGKEWKSIHLDSAKRDIEYHTKGWAEEVERVESRNKWIKQLRESLKK
jgi:hypothetical protein